MADVKVRVSLDAAQAKRDAQDLASTLGKAMESQSRRTGFGFAASMGTTAALYRFFFPTQLAGAAAAFGDAGNIIGRSTPVGAEAADFWARQGAKRTASEQTAEMFGLSGTQATREQILGAYHQLAGLQTLEDTGKQRVLNVIAEARVADLWKQVSSDFFFAVKNFDEVVKQLGIILGGGR